VYHLVRHTIGEKNHKIRFADLIFKPCYRLDKCLYLMLIFLTDIHVLALHALISPYYYYTHKNLRIYKLI